MQLSLNSTSKMEKSQKETTTMTRCSQISLAKKMSLSLPKLWVTIFWCGPEICPPILRKWCLQHCSI